VLDVKTGSGAFMKTEADATALAQTMIDIARAMQKEAVALITDMNQPLGRAVGNALEVMEAFDTLRGKETGDFNRLCRELAAEMLVLGRAADDLQQARSLYDEMISSGKALDKMRQIIEAQGGESRAVDDYSILPQAKRQHTVVPPRSGYVRAIDTAAIGQASMLVGAGRSNLDSKIDLGVGLIIQARIGDEVTTHSPLVTLYFNDAAEVQEAAQMVERAYTIGDERLEPPALIKKVLR
jgi:pyrimidine-nucleoside phosphorylase